MAHAIAFGRLLAQTSLAFSLSQLAFPMGNVASSSLERLRDLV
jgi:hypothetical protein